MPIKNPFASVFKKIVAFGVKAKKAFTTILADVKTFAESVVTIDPKIAETTTDSFIEYLNVEGFTAVGSDYLESEAYQRSKEVVSFLSPNDIVQDEMKIQTTSMLKAKNQYLFYFKGEYEGGFERTSEVVSLLSDNELSMGEAYTQMYDQIKNRRGKTFIGLMDVEELTFQGVRSNWFE